MIRLELKLPEATVNYNENGALVGVPVEHTPNQIKNFGMPFEITGYVTKHDFLAYSLYSPARKLTVGEQISLLTSLGFKTIPYFESEVGQGNNLITIKNQYSTYDARWITLPSGTEFKIPELVHINAVDWEIGPDRALTLVATTDKGVYRVIDMKLVPYYQPGCTAKLWNGELQPMNTAPVTCPAPTFCPKCNNPLKRVQIYPDLPMFYKCTSSLCEKLVLDDAGTAVADAESVADIEQTIEEESATPSVEISDTADVSEESVEAVADEDTTETVEAADTSEILKCYVDTAKVDAAAADELVVAGKIALVDNVEDADCILTKSKLAVSKNARNLSKEFNKELKPITDFE